MKKGQVFFRLAPYLIIKYDFIVGSACEDVRRAAAFPLLPLPYPG